MYSFGEGTPRALGLNMLVLCTQSNSQTVTIYQKFGVWSAHYLQN